jgi:hypothetical protein
MDLFWLSCYGSLHTVLPCYEVPAECDSAIHSCRPCCSICICCNYSKTALPNFKIVFQFFNFLFHAWLWFWVWAVEYMAWSFSVDSVDSCIQIPFRLLHLLPSRYSRTHLKIIDIRIWPKLASPVGMPWYVTWDEIVFQHRIISEFTVAYTHVSLDVEA